MWTVVHINAAELVSICQLSTTLSIHGLTAHPGHEVKPHCLHPQQKLSCGGAVPCYVPLCAGSKLQILLDVAFVHGCAHFCPICWVDFPSKAKLVASAATKGYGLGLMLVPLAMQMEVTSNLRSFNPSAALGFLSLQALFSLSLLR